MQTENNVRLMAELNQHSDNSRSVIILIHGWEGSSESAYLLSMSARLFSEGHDTLRLHLRDHGNTTHLNREIFNSSMIAEVVQAIDVFQKQYAYNNYYLAGFSLGGNFALRTGLHNEQLFRPLDRIMAVCPVLDPAHTMQAMNNSFPFYDYYFARKWKRSLKEKTKHFPDYDYLNDLETMRRLDEMNAYFIPRYTPFDNLPDYFRSYTITGDVLSELKMPVLIVASKDDPIIPHEDFDCTRLSLSTRLEMTEYGAHCAHLQNLTLGSWLDDRATDYFRS